MLSVCSSESVSVRVCVCKRAHPAQEIWCGYMRVCARWRSFAEWIVTRDSMRTHAPTSDESMCARSMAFVQGQRRRSYMGKTRAHILCIMRIHLYKRAKYIYICAHYGWWCTRHPRLSVVFHECESTVKHCTDVCTKWVSRRVLWNDGGALADICKKMISIYFILRY